MTNDKRPGSRDISDLKARLGLKKSERSKRGTGGPAGVVPPPGMATPGPAQSRGPVPAPPGARPAISPADSAGMSQQGPEVIVIREGENVEEVGGGKSKGRLAKIGAFMLIPLALGAVGGAVYQSKQGGADVAKVKSQVKDAKDVLAKVGSVLIKARQENYKVNPETTEELTKLYQNLPDLVNTKAVYASNLKNEKITGLTLTFFEKAKHTRSLLSTHLRAAKPLEATAKEIEEKNKEKFKNLRALGVVLKFENGKAVGEVVQLRNWANPEKTQLLTVRDRKKGDSVPYSVFRATDKDAKAGFDSVIQLVPNPVLGELLQDKEYVIPNIEYASRLKELDELVNGQQDEDGTQKPGLVDTANALIRNL